MKFLAYYIPMGGKNLAPYYRTIHADNQPEARMIAKRYERKAFILLSLTSQE